MTLAFQLAYRNLIGAGLRTWLNILVLSFVFVLIIFFHGIIDGWNQQAKQDTIAWEYGHGHLRHQDYDPYDPFSIQAAHAPLAHASAQLSPVLIRQASIYPDGRMLSVALKGIPSTQQTLALPTHLLQTSDAAIPALIGQRMADVSNLKTGDEVLLRWRDKNGTFDAANITIAGIFNTNVPSIDNAQIWLNIEQLWQMTALEGHASYFVAAADYQHLNSKGWQFIDQQELSKNLDEIIATKKISVSILYLLLLSIALLAIFDTQVLSIFRRQKEIGTYIALGMTPRQVLGLFTVEGAMYSILATCLAIIYGTPLLAYVAQKGIPIPQNSQDMGISIPSTIYPVYSLELIMSTILLIVFAATLVSFLPAKKIANMNPVLAIKGKLQ